MKQLFKDVRAGNLEAVFSSRYGRRALVRPGAPERVEVFKSREKFERAYGVLERLLALGADPTYVHPTLGRPAPEAFTDEAVGRFLRA